MDDDIPELEIKLTKEMIAAAKPVGKGADLRNLIIALRLLGVFGTDKNSNKYISHRIYVTSMTRKRDKNGHWQDVLNDQYAVDRINNILDSKHPVTEPEMAYLRLCVRKAFGHNRGAVINDEEILDGSAHLLLCRIMSESPKLDWSHIDPIEALQTLALTCDQQIDINFNPIKSTQRWADQDDGHQPEFPEHKHYVVKQGTKFYLTIPRKQSRSKPLVLNFAQSTGHTPKSNIEARAQMMAHIVETDDRQGPWRISKRNNKPFTIRDNRGVFGFLAIVGAGLSADQLFPEDFDPYALTNGELQHLFEQLIKISTSGNRPKMGMFFYTVQP